MPQMNYLNVAETYGRGVKDRQAADINQMNMDQSQYAFDEKQRLDNAKWLAAVGKFGQEADPSSYPQLMPAIEKEGQRRGIWERIGDGNFDYTVAHPDEIRQGFDRLHEQGMMNLQGMSGPPMENLSAADTPYAQQDPVSQEITQVGATPKGPSSPMQNYAYREHLVATQGEGSDQVRVFDNYVRANQYQTINQVPTQMSPSGNRPLSTLESEAEAANTIKMAEGEGGRGRTQQPGGSFAPVEGTEADIKAKEDKRKRGAGAYMKSIQAQTVVEDTTRLREQIAAGTVPFRREAALQEKLDPLVQSEGYRNAISLIESVKGNVGIDSLLRIKASGAGLGQVPQTQLDMLSRLLGELDLKQGEPQFTRTWDRMEQIYNEIMNTADGELEALEMTRPEIFQSSPAVQDRLLEQAREAIREGRSSRAAVESKLQEMGIDPGRL